MLRPPRFRRRFRSPNAPAARAAGPLAFLTVCLTLTGCASLDDDAAKEPFAIVGFSVPESALHDTSTDLYLVSNINGSPFGDDGKGFISRVRPDGTIAELKWIDGSREDVTLNAPKGLAIVDEVLYVTDVTVVRKFARETGSELGSISIPGATFLNDLAAANDGTVYVSDTGLGPGFTSSETDAVYAIAPDDTVSTIAKSVDLGQPNGLLADAHGVIVVNWTRGEIYRLARDGVRAPIVKLPKAQGDGLIRTGDGSLFATSWEGSCVFQSRGAEIVAAFDSLDAPADVGYDAERGRLLVPLFNKGELHVLPLPGGGR